MALAKPVSASAIEQQYDEVFPHHLNPKNTVFGGHFFAGADKVGALVAEMHTGRICVIRHAEADFFAPAHQGDVLIYRASVNRAWDTSLEVGVKVLARRLTTQKLRHVFSAHIVFIALDEHDRPASIPAVIPKTSAQHSRYDAAEVRRWRRLNPGQKK